MSRILLVALAIVPLGCASFPMSQSLPDYSMIHAVPAPQRSAEYKRLGIADTRGDLVCIGGQWFTSEQFRQISAQVNEPEVTRLIDKSTSKRSRRWISSFGIPTLGGLVVGSALYLLAGLFKTVNGGYFLHNQWVNGDPNLFYIGAATGLGVGLTFTGLDYFYLQPNLRGDMLILARKKFNEELWLRLNQVSVPPAAVQGAP